MVVEILSRGNFSMSGIFASLSANPVTNKRKGLWTIYTIIIL